MRSLPSERRTYEYMANTSSAKKAKRASLKRRVFNTRRKKAMSTAQKGIEKLIEAKSAKEASAMLPAFFKAVDKAAKEKTIHPNTAARMKSRASKRIAALAK